MEAWAGRTPESVSIMKSYPTIMSQCNKVGHNTQTDRQTERILCSAVAELSAELIQTDRQTEFSVPQSPKSQSRQ